MTIEPGDPTLTIADGRLTIGYVYEDGEAFSATDKEGHALGTFVDLSAAHTAIIEHRKLCLATDASRSGSS